MAWPKQFGGGTRMNTNFIFMANGFCLNPYSNEQDATSWAEKFSKDLGLRLLNLFYNKDEIFAIIENGHFSLKLSKKHSIEAEFEMSYGHLIDTGNVLKNLENELMIIDPCHILLSKNFYFTVEKAEGFHLKNEAIVWIN